MVLNIRQNTFLGAVLRAVVIIAASGAPIGSVHAQDNPGNNEGAYLAPMGVVVVPGTKALDVGYGGSLGIGYRLGRYAFELSFNDTRLGTDGGSKVKEAGGNINLLVFPLPSLPNLYGLLGAGGRDVRNYPSDTGDAKFSLPTLSAGLGYLWGLQFGQYEFGIRTEALYRFGHRDKSIKPEGDPDAPRNFDDALIGVGLQLPLGLKHEATPAPSEPVAVVPVGAPTDSNGDSDGD
ncbi:MAG: hypothetical protein JWQ90_1622 [Hydrocarboniphaga sp.]|uniref:hypothetical protein n=1 Tax=Hydrocarboniphaga sp. TaxID=2033016 RepID=UPI00261A338A|nr:hypothetical protein [Hydrocarboniphaga sp.]MDB5969172.1 hypothetical protein [Hydrocarboniphaga sp.]